MIQRIAAALAAVLLSGCMTAMREQPAPLMSSSEYQARPPLGASLFPSDQAVLSDEAIQRILSSKVELREKAKLAVMKFPSGDDTAARYYGYYYWRQEEYLKTQAEYSDALSTGLSASKRLAEVTPLPSLMIPKQASIPVLREAALRMQADLLLVFRITSDTYYKYSVFAKDKVKAYSTCEAVLLDVRTGIVPFTKIVTREKSTTKQASDLDLNETMRRTEKDAALDALKSVSDDLVGFLGSLPANGG